MGKELDEVTMPLDSTDTFVKAIKGDPCNGQATPAWPKRENMYYQKKPWTYLFVQRNKVNVVNQKLREAFPTFIHTTIIYKREKSRIKKEERPTISGLIFVQGEGKKVQSFLNQNFIGIYLAKDCSTKEVAIIQDDIMQPFMRMSHLDPLRIRFMPHVFEYYAKGNHLVKITSGVLAGLKGYIVRIARDRCLITTIGGMTVSIGGIHKDNFENVDEYVKQRRSSRRKAKRKSSSALTSLQEEIDKSFFKPKNELDVMAIVQSLTMWVISAKKAINEKDFGRAIEISIFVLEEIGCRFASVYYDTKKKKQAEYISAISSKFDKILAELLGRTDISVEQKENIETRRESIVIRFPFLLIDE